MLNPSTSLKAVFLVFNGEWDYCMECTSQTQGNFMDVLTFGKGVYQDIHEKICSADEEGNPVPEMPEMVVEEKYEELQR